MNPFRLCGPPKKVPEILSSESLLKKNILPIPLSSSVWPLNRILSLSEWEVGSQMGRSYASATGPQAGCVFPSRPAVQTTAVRPRAPGSQGSHACALTIPNSCVPSPLEVPYLFVLSNHKAHFKARLFQEVCPSSQSPVSSHLRAPGAFVIQSSGRLQRSCVVCCHFTSAGLICEWLELRVSASFVPYHDS